MLGIDIADVLEDGLDSYPCSEATRMALTQPHSDSPPETALLIAEASSYSTTLEYAIDCLPLDSALQLIQESCMPLDGAPLTYATGADDVQLIKALLEAGADVNARNWEGWTALHVFSKGACLEHLQTLVVFAEDIIDWGARNPEGQTALQLAKESTWMCTRTQDEVDGIFNILRARIPDGNNDEAGEIEDTTLNMPGAYT